jgi:hypothetical protein
VAIRAFERCPTPATKAAAIADLTEHDETLRDLIDVTAAAPVTGV